MSTKKCAVKLGLYSNIYGMWNLDDFLSGQFPKVSQDKEQLAQVLQRILYTFSGVRLENRLRQVKCDTCLSKY